MVVGTNPEEVVAWLLRILCLHIIMAKKKQYIYLVQRWWGGLGNGNHGMPAMSVSVRLPQLGEYRTGGHLWL